jgi:GAF domain-containing protein
VNLTYSSPTEPNTKPQATWIWAATIVSLLATIVGISVLTWQADAIRDATWHWIVVIALGYLVPVTLIAFHFGSEKSIAVATISILTIIPSILQCWRLNKPLGTLIALVSIALILFAWAYLLGNRTDAKHHQDAQMQRYNMYARSAQQIACLADIGKAFRVGQSLPEILQLTAQSISEGVGFERVLISLTEREPPVLCNVAAIGFSPSEFEKLQSVQHPLSAIQEVMREEFRIEQSYFVPYHHRSAWVDSLRACSSVEESGSELGSGILILPMYGMAHKITGIIVADQPLDDRIPDRPLVQTLQVFAQQAALSMDNYQLHNDLQRRADNLILINEVGRTIASGLDSESVQEELVAASAQLLDSNCSVLYFWNEKNEWLRPQVAYGISLQKGGLFNEFQLRELSNMIVKKGRSLIIPDLDEDPTFGNSPAQQLDLKSMLIVPLAEGRKVSGVLVTAATHSGAFDRTDQILVSTLTDQASVAIQNARLYESTSLRVSQLAMLNDLGKTIISSLDMDTALTLIVNKVEEAFNVEAGSVLLVEQGRLVRRTSFGFDDDRDIPHTLELGQGVTGWVALTGISTLIPDTEKDTRHFAGQDQKTALKTRSLLCVPLKGPENRIIGALEIINPPNEHVFTEQDQELLESIATFAVIALQNAQLYQQTVHYVTDLSSLYEVGKDISSTLDIEDTLQATVDEAVRLTSAARSQIMLINAGSERIAQLKQQGFDAGARLSHTYDQVHQGINGWVLGEKIPTLSADIHQDERMRGVSVEQFVGPDARSLIIAPLLIKGRAVGTLSAVRLTDAGAFTERELGLLNMLAGQASVAIENAYLFEERKRQIAALSILNQTGQALSSTLKLQDLMELIYHK